MTVFTLPGSKIFTDPLGQIVKTQDASLDVVTRIGTNTLELAYLGDGDNPYAVSLGDYNLVFDGTHLNDGQLPDGVEFYDLTNNDGHSVRVVNFVFNSNDGVEERMFSVGQSPLPQFQTPLEASTFLAQYEPVKITSVDDMGVRLDHIKDVDTKGVFIDFLNPMNNPFFDENDGFDFNDLSANIDTELWDGTFAPTDDGEADMSLALASHNTEENHETDPAEWADVVDAPDDAPLDPHLTDLSDG